MAPGIRIAVGLVLAIALAGCDGERSATTANPAPNTTQTPPPQRVTLADAKRCPVTPPSAVGPRGVSPDVFFGWGSSYGNGRLWVGGLWPQGVIAAGPDFVDKDGSVSTKLGWWRAITGHLRIRGRRLDASAPPLRAIAPLGYGDTGFQASSVSFPTEGCWQVTGEVGTTTLTFVTFVIKRGA